MICEARVGLLVPRSCGEAAAGNCSSCGKGLCFLHLGDGTCPSCRLAAGNTEDEYAGEESNRQYYYQTYGEGSEFGDTGYFTEGDHESLRRGIVSGEMRHEFERYDAFET